MDTKETSKRQYSIPILFIVFNRPEHTDRVFDVIRQIRPKKLYIAADGPRYGVPEDQTRVDRVRAITSKIDWPCEFKPLFHNQNLGCQKAVTFALNWFFENEQWGVVLEDDCLPNENFFYFCEHGLREFQYNRIVASISGTNLLSESDGGYQTFSLHGSIWGWASWSDRWSHYDVSNLKLSISDCFHYATTLREFLNIIYIRSYIGKASYDSWDYQWLFLRIRKRMLTLMPKYNYIKNIGFADGAHFKGDTDFLYPKLSANFHYQSGIIPTRDFEYDRNLWLFKNRYFGLKKIIFIMLKILRKR